MSLHIKRLAAPRSWPIPRKTGGVFVPKPEPGAHPTSRSLPLGLVLRDILKVCDTYGQASRIVHQKDVLLDGKPARSAKQAVGFMDVIQLPRLERTLRVLLDKHGRIAVVDVDASQAGWKFCRIEGKTTVKGGKSQLNLHDGRNVLVKETAYATGDVLKLKLPEQKVLGHYKLGEGATAMITGGAHTGQLAKVKGVEATRSPKANLIHLTSGETPFSTVEEYVFVVGKENAEITLPEAM